VIVAVFPAVARRSRRRVLRQMPATQRAAAAWGRACRSVTRAGVPGRPSMTSSEWASATAHELPVAARPMASLAHVIDRFEFARPGSLDDVPGIATVGRDCELWADQIDRIASDSMGSSGKLRRYFTDWR